MQDALHHPNHKNGPSRSETTGKSEAGTNGGTIAAIRSLRSLATKRVIRFSFVARQSYA